MTEPPDDALIERLRASDLTALDRLMHRYQGGLYRYAATLVRHADAADVVQDVFLRVWEMREGLAIRVSCKALLYRMTRNAALNKKRKLRRVDLPGRLPDVTAPAEESAEALRLHIEAWIRSLPPRRAEAFMLSRYHDLSHEQISRIMGLSVRTVQTHIVHALRDLREAMASFRRAEEASLS